MIPSGWKNALTMHNSALLKSGGNWTSTGPRLLNGRLSSTRQKLNLTEGSLTPFGSNATGLLHAQEMITRHQTVLANLVLLYPNTTGLGRAYNNSLFLEQKFGEKTEMRFTRFIEKNNKTVFKAVKLEIRKQDRARENNSTVMETSVQDRDKIREKIKDQKDVTSG